MKKHIHNFFLVSQKNKMSVLMIRDLINQYPEKVELKTKA